MHASFRFFTLMAFFVIAICPDLFAQTFKVNADSIITAEFKDPDGPGGLFMVSKGGKIVYQKSIGKANLELDVAISPESVFQLGSMTKQFTAVAILMLEEQGKLQVSDLVYKYISDYPGGNNITLHHLLTHTSGIKDFTKMKALQSIAQKEMTPHAMVDFFKNEPVDFLPGEKFDYNNSGYVLLGYIIELVSKESYEDFINNHIFKKLKMDQSRYASDRQIVKHRAYGYHLKQNGYVNKTVINFSVPFASGSLMSTVGDMLKWQNALNKNLLLSAGETKKAFTAYTLNNGESIHYGYGWHIREINGLLSHEHGGSIFGFKTMGIYVPEKDMYVIGFSNCDCHSPTKITEEIARLFLN